VLGDHIEINFLFHHFSYRSRHQIDVARTHTHPLAPPHFHRIIFSHFHTFTLSNCHIYTYTHTNTAPSHSHPRTIFETILRIYTTNLAGICSTFTDISRFSEREPFGFSIIKSGPVCKDVCKTVDTCLAGARIRDSDSRRDFLMKFVLGRMKSNFFSKAHAISRQCFHCKAVDFVLG
jgi:hypothetical protein